MTDQHMTYTYSRLQNYKTKHPSYWREMVRYRKGYTRYGQRLEHLHTATGKTYWHWTTGESMYHLGYVDELAPRLINHRGWYVDDDGDMGTIRGLVLKIRTPRGTIYAPGTQHSDCDGHSADLTKGEYIHVHKGADQDEHDDAIRSVCQWADSMAESDAEKEREYQRVYRAQQDADDAEEHVTQVRKEAGAVVQALREAKLALGGDTPQLWALLHSSLRRARQELRNAVEQLHKARENEAEVRRYAGITERV